MSILSIGTVVRLKNGERKLMIMSRTPLANENGRIGYFDYGGCLFPEGQVNQQSYFLIMRILMKSFMRVMSMKLKRHIVKDMKKR